MKKWFRLLCSTFCFLNITLPGNLLATPLMERADSLDEQTEQTTKEDNELHLAFMTGNFGLQSVSMQAGNPLDTMLLYLSDGDGRLINNAQVITTLIDQHGHQYASRATPYKCGYFVAIDQLPVGQYRVETEIIANAQLQTKEFMINKA